ncbi:shikimate kinase [Escherichia coli]
MAGESFILMGVSGSGKTLIGSKVAALLSAKFIDGDDLHPAKNIVKMRRVFHYLMKIDFPGWNA